MKHLMTAFGILISSILQGYDIEIQEHPVTDFDRVEIKRVQELEGISNHASVAIGKIEDGTPLLKFLGGEKNIERILVYNPMFNASQIEFSEALVRRRINESVCVDSKKEEWHYAPYTTGTIYLIDGRKQKFTMYLSGFSIDGHLFAKSSHSPK